MEFKGVEEPKKCKGSRELERDKQHTKPLAIGQGACAFLRD
jgi:hypothetical protein